MTLAEWEARACTSKVALGERAARAIASRATDDDKLTAYSCPFGEHYHVGHPLTPEHLAELAGLLRARSGNAPAEPGTGTTRRRARQCRT